MRQTLIMDDAKNEMQHQYQIWNKSKQNFNKLMQEKIQELGYHAHTSDLGEEKKYKLKISYYKKDKKATEEAKKKYMMP